jgi:methionyl-tRNA formyltransferase
MIRVGFIGRTKFLFNTIQLFSKIKDYEISFIWTCKEEEYYDFESSNFKLLANRLGVKYIYSSKINKNQIEVTADVVISINFINIIPKTFIASFKYGVINAHAGDLPRYRGNANINWAIINEEEKIALTFHFMDEYLDSGPIIKKYYFKISENTYIGDIFNWMSDQIPIGFLNACNSAINGYMGVKQKGRVLRSYPRIITDSKMDFTRDSDWNLRIIRSSSRPFSGAFAFLNNLNTKVTIYRAVITNVEYDFLAVSGQIIDFNTKDYSFLIAINNQVIKIVDYSVDGLSIIESFAIITASKRNRLT